MRRTWLALCFIGTALPYAVFVPWLVQQGLDLRLLYAQASATPIAAFAWLDVLISAAAVLLLAARRLARGERRFWLVVAGTCAVGVSLGLPLHLYMSDRSRADAPVSP